MPPDLFLKKKFFNALDQPVRQARVAGSIASADVNLIQYLSPPYTNSFIGSLGDESLSSGRRLAMQPMTYPAMALSCKYLTSYLTRMIFFR